LALQLQRTPRVFEMDMEVFYILIRLIHIYADEAIKFVSRNHRT
jgi:hypothetical protein